MSKKPATKLKHSRSGNPGVDTVGPLLNATPFDHSVIPLVAPAMCQDCEQSHFHVGSIVPGFVVTCPQCEQDREVGLVIQCVTCHAIVCGYCIYESFVKGRPLPVQH